MHSYNYYNTEYIFLILFIYIAIIESVKVDSENKSAEDESVSLESESNEPFNTSSKEQPVRLKHEKEKDISNANITNNLITCEDETKLSNELKKPNYSIKTNYSYLVSVQKKGSHYATGALVNKKWILTVAGQFYNIRESIKLLKVRLGSVNCKKGGILVPLKEIVIHPDYQYMKPRYDLALLRIAHPLKFSEIIKPINLSNIKGRIRSAKFLTSYWPRLIINNKLLPYTASERIKQNNLRVSIQKMIPQEKCFHILKRYNYTLDRTALCLEPLISHHSPCTPDPGAPVVTDDGLWGITSGWTSEDCMENPSPTIFNRVSISPIKPWLETFLKSN